MDYEKLREIAQIEKNSTIGRSEADVYLARAILELDDRIEELEKKLEQG